MKKHLSIVILTVIASVLIFANLGNQFLWQDEAETAVLAKNTLEYGFPRAFDGKNFINPRLEEFYGIGYGENYAWLYHPWVQFYLTAFSFLLLGINTFAARFPFAMIGVLNVPMLYILSYKLKRSRFVAFCAALLMTFSVPYLLLMRQSRYYAPAVFLVLFILLFYFKFREKRSIKDLILLSFGMILLGYTVHGIFVPLFAAVAFHYLVFSFDKKIFLKMALAGIVILATVAPWFLYSKSLAHAGSVSLENVWKNFEFQVRMTNKYIFPMLFFMGVYGVRILWLRKVKINVTQEEKNALKILSCVLFMSVVAFCFAEQRNFRYFVYYIPILGIIEGIILERLVKFKKYILTSFLSISIFTGFFYQGDLQMLFPKYLYEITHDYDGPIEGIVKFLNKNAKPGEEVKIIYGDHSLIFYTDLKIDNSWVYDKDHMPEWIVFRHGWHEQLSNAYYTEVSKKYIKHVLDYPDIRYENRPGDLGYHRFWTDQDAPKVVIFEKANR